ncbi:hypothetical protein Ddye_014615 [Dipteronia dyeriana]|uniref:Zinc finger CCCH domain-containing protein 62-like n=1 Tax=Dipteronia dyeriana TaxID=168575 RepID=A0AAE0CKR9_9ROSI|nr:hypothetical protein Ddye_014615 [Dipteronia dyeriana]
MEVYEGKNEDYLCISPNEGSDPGDDDSDMDPDYCFLEGTHEKLSQLSIRKKSKSRCSSSVKDQEERKENVKGFELVYKIIENGDVEKLKLEQCKVYLRKNGLRLTGNKSTLIQRVKEHLQISNGEGEKMYPVSSFVLNCKGDACTGDVVMFEQNVYEMFNIASRSASGPPCGKRIVAGRIVKESYGATKQQHTFTIEVLWSKGEKPLPPLHPLLIKGRNLYRLETLRQRWEDEGERRKVLMEKHVRGSHARSNRETRICEKEMRKQHKENRVTMEGPKTNQSRLNVQSQVSQRPVKNGEFREVQQQRDENFRANHRQPNLSLKIHQPPISIYPNRNGADLLSVRTDYIPPLKSIDNYQLPRSLCTNDGRPFLNNNVYRPTNPLQRQGWMKQQLCHFYPQGRCFRGDNCRFLHEMRQECDRTQDHGHRKFENAGIRRL